MKRYNKVHNINEKFGGSKSSGYAGIFKAIKASINDFKKLKYTHSEISDTLYDLFDVNDSKILNYIQSLGYYKSTNENKVITEMYDEVNELDNFNLLLHYTSSMWCPSFYIENFVSNYRIDVNWDVPINKDLNIWFTYKNEIIYNCYLSNEKIEMEEITNVGYALVMSAQKQLLNLIEEEEYEKLTDSELKKYTMNYQKQINSLKRKIVKEILV